MKKNISVQRERAREREKKTGTPQSSFFLKNFAKIKK
jgi:hypothetical protein